MTSTGPTGEKGIYYTSMIYCLTIVNNNHDNGDCTFTRLLKLYHSSEIILHVVEIINTIIIVDFNPSY